MGAETAPLMAKTCPFACEQCKREMTEEVAKKEETVKREEEEGELKEAAKREVDDLMEEAKKEGAAREEEARKREEAEREVRAAMAEEKAILARSFAGLLSDTADAADVDKRSCRDFSPKCGQ